MAEPYKIPNKSSAIDILLAGARGALSGALSVEERNKQREAIAAEQRMKMLQIQNQQDQLDQQWKIHIDDIEQRKQEQLSQQTFDLNKTKLIASLNEESAKKDLMRQIVISAMNMQQQAVMKTTELMYDNYNKEEDRTVERERNKASLELTKMGYGFRGEQLGLNRSAQEYSQFKGDVGMTVDILNAQKQILGTLNSAKSVARMNTLTSLESKYGSIAIGTGKDADAKLDMQLSIQRAFEQEAAGVSVVAPIRIKIKRSLAPDIDKTISLDEYKRLASTGQFDDGTLLNSKEANSISNFSLPKEVEAEINSTVDKDKEVMRIMSDLTSLQESVKSRKQPLSSLIPSPTIEGQTNQTQVVKPVPKEILPTKTKDPLSNATTFKDLVVNIASNLDVISSIKYIDANRERIIAKFGNTQEVIGAFNKFRDTLVKERDKANSGEETSFEVPEDSFFKQKLSPSFRRY